MMDIMSNMDEFPRIHREAEKKYQHMKKININNIIKIQLTDRGKDIYYHQYDKLNKFYGTEYIKPEYPKVDEDGFTEFQLWDFMSIYGPYMFNGMKQVIKYNNIYIDGKYLEDCDESR